MTIGTPKGTLKVPCPFKIYNFLTHIPKVHSTSDIYIDNNWHTKGHTDSFIQDQGKIKKNRGIDAIGNWYNKGHANSSMSISRYITVLLKGNISGIDPIDNWHTKDTPIVLFKIMAR